MSEFLLLSDVRKDFGAFAALKGVSLQVHAGEVVTLIGGNGAGKSTLMRAISGLEPAAGGRIVFNGRDLAATPAHRRASESRMAFERATGSSVSGCPVSRSAPRSSLTMLAGAKNRRSSGFTSLAGASRRATAASSASRG